MEEQKHQPKDQTEDIWDQRIVTIVNSSVWVRDMETDKENDQDLQVFINKCLCQILNIRWLERFTNAEVWRRTNQTPIFQTIKQRKWRCIGHILCRPQNNITKQALELNPLGKSIRDRPVTKWRRLLAAELKSIWMPWGEAKKAAHDRTKWRAIVKALCSPRSEEEWVSVCWLICSIPFDRLSFKQIDER
jgi:hypothetical protein